MLVFGGGGNSLIKNSCRNDGIGKLQTGRVTGPASTVVGGVALAQTWQVDCDWTGSRGHIYDFDSHFCLKSDTPTFDNL